MAKEQKDNKDAGIETDVKITNSEEFIKYIYKEYWEDDLSKDRFVPTPCIQAHFKEDIEWIYGKDKNKNTDKFNLIGSYNNHDGMSLFLSNWGNVFKVEKWDPSKIELNENNTIAEIDMDCVYNVRKTNKRFEIKEHHVLVIKDLQIAKVEITFDEDILINNLG